MGKKVLLYEFKGIRLGQVHKALKAALLKSGGGKTGVLDDPGIPGGTGRKPCPGEAL